MVELRKPIINLVLIGDAGHGKSTLVGRLLSDLGRVGEATLARLRSLASRLGDEGRYLAFIVDKQLEERKRGHTIEVTSCEPLEVGGSLVKLIDVPGIMDWVGNTIAGIAQADAALLVVDAPAALAKDPGGLVGLREHITLAVAFGIEQAIVAVNKMDLVGYEEGAYAEARARLAKLMGGLGLRATAFIPISALHGDNVVRASENTPWYSGPTLYEALGGLEEPPRPLDRPLRLPIHRHYERGNIAAGVLASGKLSIGDEVVIAPSGGRGEVASMQAWGRGLDVAYAGDDVGIRIRGVARYHIKKGFVVGHVGDEAPRVARAFVGRVKVLSPRGLWPGFCPLAFCHQAKVPCRVGAILRRVEPGSGDVLEEQPKLLREGEVGDVLLEPLVPKQKGLVIEPYDELPQLARFVLRASVGRELGTITVAMGKCLEVEPY